MPTSLVTGAAGFMGSHVAQHLKEEGHRIVAVDDLSGGFIDNLPAGAHFIRADVTDAKHMAVVFDRWEPDYVFHLAAYAAEGLSHFIRRFNYTNNVLGSVTLINESVKHHVRRFVFTSSIAVYGTNQLPMTEELTPKPEDPYGIAKYAVELDLAAAHKMFGLEYTIFRPHNVYGPGQNTGDKYRNVIAIFMNEMMHGRPISIFGDGLQQRAFSYIDDVAPIIAESPHVPGTAGQVFNVGADRAYSVLELAQTVADAFNGETMMIHLPSRNEVDCAYASHDKLRLVYGPLPVTDLEDGIDRMGHWLRITGPREQREYAGAIEVTTNLPPSWLPPTARP